MLRLLVSLLLVIGLLGHVLSARAIGGSQLAYTHHIGGFFLILIVTGALIAGLGRLFKRPAPVTVLAVALAQAILGVGVFLLTVRTH